MSTGLVLATALAAAAVLLGLRSPAVRHRRVLQDVGPAPAAPRRAARLLHGRPDAPPLGRRVGLCAAAATGLCAGASQSLPALGSWTWLAWPVLLAGGVLALGWLEPRAARRRQQRLVLEAPQALELLAACLAVGAPPRSACAAVVEAFDGPVGEDLQRVLGRVELGVGDAEAWSCLAGHPQLGPAAADLARSVESGARMVEALRSHADAAREQRRAALQQAARSVGVRSVLPLMACFIPAFLLLGVVPTVVSAVLQAFR